MMDFLAQFGSVLLGVLLLGILVAVHEFGHFIAARLTGIEVMEFAVGMGPKIVGWTGKKGTKFSLRWIPFGGFCAFYGEDDVDGKAKDDPRAYNKQAVWKRIITVAMGPVMNFVLAFVVAVGFYWATGFGEITPVIDSVEASRPAETAGILPGDEITAVNGEELAYAADIRAAIMADAEPKTLTILRGGEELTLTLTPFLDDQNQHRIGVTFQTREFRLTFPQAVKASADYCYQASRLIVDALGQIFTNKEIRDATSGPVGAVQQISQQVMSDGLLAFVSLLVVISINLGIMNLLPIPGLDGSRLIFHIVEGVRRKPIMPEVEGMIHLAGTLLLLGLLALLTFRDVGRLF